MRRFADAVPRLFLLIALLSCSSDSTGPSSVQRARLSLAPSFDRAVLEQVGIDRVLVRFTRSDGTKALETVASFPTGSDTLNLSVAVPLNSEAEAFGLSLLLIDDPAADTVFRSGPTPVILKTGVSQPTVVVPPFVYTGRGANATGVRLVSRPSAVQFGQTATFTAEAFDAAGVAIPNTPILWSTSDPAKASIADAAVGAVVGGTTRGNVTITASLLQTKLDTPPPSAAATLAVQPVASTLLAQSGSGQTGPAGAALAQPLRVRVNAADNLGVQGVPVAFSVTSGGGTLSATSVLTDVNGDASVTWTLGSAVGNQSVNAQMSSGVSAATVFTATAVAGSPSRLAFTTQPSAVTAGVAIAPAVVVEVQDSFGNPTSAFTGTITIALGTGPSGATLGGTTAVSAVSGVARFPDLSVSTAGTGVTLTATSTGLTGATSTAFDVGAAAPSSLAFTAQPSNATAGAAIAPAITVTARDANGKTVTSFSGPVSLALSANPGGGTLAGTTTVNAVSGVATFSGVSLAKAAAGYVLSASATGLGTATSTAFTITPAAASTLAFTTQPSSVNAGVAIAPAVVVEAQDSFGNTVTGFTGAVAMAIGTGPAGATLGGTTTVTAAAGVARFGDLTVSAAGNGVTLSASSSGLTGATSAPFNVTAGAPATLVFTTQPSNATAGSAITPSIVVTARDGNGNTASAFTGAVVLALSANPGGGALAGTTTVNAVNGVATFSGISLAKAAAGYSLSATATGLGSATSTTFNVSAATASALAFTTQPVTSAAGAVITPAVVVSAVDAFGNAATSYTGNVGITIGTNPGGATLAGTTTVAAASGVASFSNLSLTARGLGYTLVASGSGLTSATSTTFDITSTTQAWTNPSGGLWSNASNWSLGRVPQGTDSVVIAQAGTYTVSLDTTFTGSVIIVGGGSGAQTLSLTSRTLTISGTMTVKSTGALVATTSTIAGTGTLVNQGASSLKGTNITATGGLDNQGTMVVNAGVTIAGPLVTAAGSTMRLLADGTTGFSTLTSTNSFTNNGAIELTTATSSYSPTLAVSGGNTLTNGAGGTITTLVGAGGPRTIDAQIVNQGTITIAQPLTLSHASAAHANSGTIDASAADFILNQTGTSPSFTNTGTVTIGAGHSWTINGGALNQNAGSVGGAGTLALNSLTANLATNITNATTGFVANSVTINGPGTLTNASGQTMSLKAVTFGASSGLDNQGTLIANAAVTVNGALTTNAGSTLRLMADGTTGFSTFTSANSFTNNGVIELTTVTSSYSPTLVVGGSSTLTNAAGGTIASLVGAGGPRTIDAQIVNQGTITLAQPLTLAHASAAHTNSGTIDATAADFILNQSGTAPSFTNSGTVTIGAGHAWTVNGGAFNQNSGTIGGSGTISLNNLTANFATNVTNATTGFVANSVTFNGPGTLTNATGRTMSLKTVTIGATSALDNQGTLIANANVTVNGAFTTNAGSTLRLLADGSTGFSSFLSASSFTNNGLIELTTVTSSYSTVLAVAGGNTLTNSSGGTIATLVGAGGTRTIDAQLVNQGTISIAQAVTLSHASAAHANSGTIDASAADLTVNQSGTSPSFSNSGTVTIGAGHTFTVNGGVLNQTAGAINGAGTLSLNSLTANFATNFTNASTGFVANGATINGPGTITNASGQTMSLKTVTVGATSALDNQGTLIVNAAVTMNGPFTTNGGSTLRILADGSTGFSTFTTANSFTNTGLIELTTTTSSYSPTLAVAGSGTLTNAPGGTIASLVGSGGSRTIDAQLVNQGTITIAQPLTLTHASATHTNSGTIDAGAGNLTVNQSGTSPSFSNTNTGTISVGAGHFVTINGGSFSQGGTLSGSGGISLAGATTTFSSPVTLGSLDVSGGSVTFANNQSTGGLATSLSSTTVNGPGSLTNAAGQTLSLRTVAFNTNLTNQGTLITDGSSGVASSSAFTNAAGSTLRLLATGSTGNSTFSVPSFTNLGAIELTTTVSSYTTALNVSGTLTNALSGTITSLVGTGGSRTISASLNNQGVVTVLHPLALSLASATHTNSGTIDASNGDFTVNQSASTFTNTNTGTITVGAGHVMGINGGSFNQNGALNGTGGMSLSGVTASFATSFALSNLTVSGGALNFATGQSNAGVSMNLSSTTVTGGAGTTFTNVTGQTLSIRAVNFNINVLNQGTLISDGSSSVAAANTFTAPAGSLLHLEATGSTGNSTLTLPPFTNAGAIELTTSTSSYTTTLIVSAPTGTGTLTNASGGTISSLVGAGGTRTISAQLVNQAGGTITINHPLTLNRSNAAHTNSGTIDVTNADFTVSQGGTPKSFDNTGTITVGAGRTFSFVGGTFTTGALSGNGTLSLLGTNTTFNAPFTLPALSANGGTLSFTIAQSTAGINMSLISNTITAPSFTNSVGQTFNVRAVTFNTVLINQGLLVTDGATSVAGGNVFFSNAAGATLLINATGATGSSNFSAPSFTNSGAINMNTATSSYSDALTVGGGTGTLTNNPGAFITILADIGGTRTINGNLDNSGTITIHPGGQAGTLQINGAFNHQGSGVLNLEMGGPAAGSGYSRLSATGVAAISQGGTLNYSLINGYAPTTSTPFDVLTGLRVTGTFTIGTKPSAAWADPTYSSALVRLTAP